MTEMILDVQALPERIFSDITTQKVRYTLEDGIIKLEPINEVKKGNKLLKGFLKGGKLTVDYFLEEKKKEK